MKFEKYFCINLEIEDVWHTNVSYKNLILVWNYYDRIMQIINFNMYGYCILV